ncbi:MAG: hypothetical protein NVS9B7_28150 [Flavisolibacter sp.]
MKSNRFSEAQIIKAIKELDAGKDVVTICRELGVHKATLYNWRKKYGGMEVSQLTQYKALQEENRKLKAMYADLALDHRILKEIVEKKIKSGCKACGCFGSGERMFFPGGTCLPSITDFQNSLLL